MTRIANNSQRVADRDREYLSLALMLARRGLGTTMPNPSVGAVIVRPGDAGGGADEIVGRGWTQPGGRPHAEVEALRRAGDRAQGATLYVTLEPCSHHGQSPPCADAVIAAGINRVVAGAGDPDARVAGRGFQRLRDAGIEVIEGVEREDAERVTAGHILRTTQRRPFVQVKLAVSSNDIVSHARAGAPVWVTGPAARDSVHMMRARADAVLTGIGTVLADDPELTCRLPGMAGYSPVRVVLDQQLRLPVSSKLAQTAREVPVWVICNVRPDAGKKAALEALGIKVIPVAAYADQVAGRDFLSWPDVLRELALAGVTRLMVEAGPRVARSLDGQKGLVDEYVLFRGTGTLAADQGTNLRDILSMDHLEALNHLEVMNHLEVKEQTQSRILAGGDLVTVLRR